MEQVNNSDITPSKALGTTNEATKSVDPGPMEVPRFLGRDWKHHYLIKI